MTNDMQKMTRFSDEDWTKILEFASKIDTDHYAVRNGQTNAQKRTIDQMVGKAAEFGAYYTLKDRCPDLPAPDCAIYNTPQKSWKVDLGSIGVKGQDVRQAKKYGLSWVFERTDRGKPAYVVFVAVDVEDKSYRVVKVAKYEDIKFSEMKIQYLRKTKIAVYAAENGWE